MSRKEVIEEGKGLRLKLSHKILGLVITVLIFAGSGAVISGMISNKRLEGEIIKKVADGFDTVFANIKSIFKNFQGIAEESVRKTSGLVALDAIKKIAQKGQNKFQEYTQKVIQNMGKDVSSSLEELAGTMSKGFDSSLEVASNAVGDVINESTKSQDLLAFLATLRVASLADASSEGLKKINEALDYLKTILVEDTTNHEDLTTKFQEKIDENTMTIITILNQLAADPNGFSPDTAMNLIMPFQEELKDYIAKENKNVYKETRAEITRISKVIKEQMRLMSLKIKSDGEKEKVISASILNNLFEKSIAKVIDVQSKAKNKAVALERTFSKKIEKMNTDIPKELSAYGAETKKEIDARAAETIKGAAAVIDEAKKSLNDSQMSAMEEMKKIGGSSVEKVKRGISGVGKATVVSLTISMIIIGIIFTIISLFVVRTITHPSSVMVNMLRNMAKGRGDLTQRINIVSSDEIGELAYWFNMFVDQLRNIIKGIMHLSKRVADAAEQFSATTEESNASMEQITGAIQNVSQGATKQLGEVRKSETMFQSLRDMLNVVVANAKDAMEGVVHSAERAAQGKKATDQLSEKINSIAEAANLSTNAINELKESSKQIGDIVVTITSFADQTNLLSLNAAIEAARAGDAGRGFAVVAEEVRKLAEGSAHAANRISQLVKKIIDEIDRAVNVVVKEKHETEEGRNIVIDTGKLQEELVDIANKAKEMMVKISDLVPEQMSATEKVMGTIQSVASIAEENAAATEEVSSSVEEMTASMEEMSSGSTELAKTAQSLQEGVNQFKVE